MTIVSANFLLFTYFLGVTSWSWTSSTQFKINWNIKLDSMKKGVKYVIAPFVSASCISSSIPSPCHASESTISMTAPNKELTTRQIIIRQTESFLTNPVLEAIRKIDQLDPDTEEQFANKVISLIPIMEINKDVEEVTQLIRTHQTSDLSKAFDILSNNKFDTIRFKKTFNRYSDNIFYTDSRQANLYLNGGAIPSSQQTQQYLYRNSILTSINDIKQDLDILINNNNNNNNNNKDGNSNTNSNINNNKDSNNNNNNNPSFDQIILDSIDDCKDALDSLQNYFELADPNDVKVARQIVYKI